MKLKLGSGALYASQPWNRVGLFYSSTVDSTLQLHLQENYALHVGQLFDTTFRLICLLLVTILWKFSVSLSISFEQSTLFCWWCDSISIEVTLLWTDAMQQLQQSYNDANISVKRVDDQMQ